MSYLVHHRLLRTMALVVGPMNLGSMAVFGVLVLYVVAPGPLGLDGVGFGLLTTAIAIGTVIGTLLASRFERALGRANLFVACIGSLLVMRPRLDRDPAAAPHRRDPRGQQLTRRRIQCRLRLDPPADRPESPARPGDGQFRVISWGALPLGALLGGIIGQTLGLPAVFIAAAVIHLCLLPSRLILTNEFMAQVEAHAAETAAAESAGAETAGAAADCGRRRVDGLARGHCRPRPAR